MGPRIIKTPAVMVACALAWMAAPAFASTECQFDIAHPLVVTHAGESVRLEWEAHPSAQGYQVFRCELTSHSCAPLPQATTSELLYVDDLDGADMVWYQVAAIGEPCAPGYSCQVDRDCWGNGVCEQSWGGGCPSDLPTCGCDGQSYESPCMAGWVGASVWYLGYCQ